jgi:hypothetical protein
LIIELMLKKVGKLFKSFQQKQTPKGRFEPEPFQMEGAHTDHLATVGNNYWEIKDKIEHKLNLKRDSLSKFIRLQNKQI